MTNQSSQRLSQGKEALARGDALQAIKDFSVSISFDPSIEAYLLKAEANFCAGKVKLALDDLARAEEICRSTKCDDRWLTQIEQARNRYEGAATENKGPRIDQIISVMLPTILPDWGSVITSIAAQAGLASSGSTLVREGGTVIYDLDIYDRNTDWSDNMLALRDPAPLQPQLAKQIADHRQFVHLKAPNSVIMQSTERQGTLAIELLETLEPLMRALNAPSVLIRTANYVHTREEIQAFLPDLSVQNLVTAYARLYNAADEIFSAGMHALGYADAQISFEVIPFNLAIDVIEEFLLFQVINEVRPGQRRIEFESAVTGLAYEAQIRRCDRFDVDGEARFNPKGVWVFTRQLS